MIDSNILTASKSELCLFSIGGVMNWLVGNGAYSTNNNNNNNNIVFLLKADYS